VLTYYLLVLVMLLSEHQFWSRDFGASITPFKILGGVCVMYAAIGLAFRESLPQFLRTWQARLFLLLYVIVMVQCVANPGPRAVNAVEHWTSFLMLFFVTCSLVTSLKRLRWTLFSAIGAITLASAYVLRSWQKYHSVYENFRAEGAPGDSNYFALGVVCFLPLALWLLVTQHNVYERLGYLFACVATTAALAVGSSRGGFLALAAALAFMVLKLPHRIRNFALAAVILSVLGLAPGSPIQRTLHPTTGDQIGVDSRWTTWRAALLMMADHPFVGIGPGFFNAVVEQYEKPDAVVRGLAHNTYLELGAELGIPVMLMYIALWIVTFRSLEATRRMATKHARFIADAAVGLQAGLIAIVVGIWFLTAEHQKFPWLVVFLSIPLRTLATRAHKAALRRKKRHDPSESGAVTGARTDPSSSQGALHAPRI
jgi:putative inorganic carbon (HCO3(-)) transporter